MTSQVKPSAELVEAFAGTFLSPRYDEPCPTPEFHRTAWELYTSDHPATCVVAPRDHAKSTALTYDYILSEVMFRFSDYVILLGSTEDKAAEQLSNISGELHDNQDLRREFGVKEFLSDQKMEIIVKHDDGHTFRILARGAEQKIRGAMWKGKRPNLIVADDMEDDEQVESKDRRAKFRRWFFRAAKQALSMTGKIRVHGTILHEDSLLARLQRNKSWRCLFFKAHTGFDDFSYLLWPARWTEAKLRARQQEFVEDGDAAGYSQEFLNTPLDNSDAYIRKDDFIGYEKGTEPPHPRLLRRVAAADFAVSKADLANRTSFSVAGKDINNLTHWLDQRVDRWDSVEWIEEMFSIQRRWDPEIFFVEDGVIWKSVAPMLQSEMQSRDIWLNVVPVPSVKDKATRGRSFQRRMRAGGFRFPKDASWYASFEHEVLRFTGGSQAILDDQFDSASLLARGLETLGETTEEDFLDDEQQEFETTSRRRANSERDGRSGTTGY